MLTDLYNNPCFSIKWSQDRRRDLTFFACFLSFLLEGFFPCSQNLHSFPSTSSSLCIFASCSSVYCGNGLLTSMPCSILLTFTTGIGTVGTEVEAVICWDITSNDFSGSGCGILLRLSALMFARPGLYLISRSNWPIVIPN